MEQERKFSAAEVTELIDLIRGDEDFTPAEIAGMDKRADMLKWLVTATDADIDAAVKRHYRSARC
jgi:hypothetical protein